LLTPLTAQEKVTTIGSIGGPPEGTTPNTPPYLDLATFGVRSVARSDSLWRSGWSPDLGINSFSYPQLQATGVTRLAIRHQYQETKQEEKKTILETIV